MTKTIGTGVCVLVSGLFQFTEFQLMRVYCTIILQFVTWSHYRNWLNSACTNLLVYELHLIIIDIWSWFFKYQQGYKWYPVISKSIISFKNDLWHSHTQLLGVVQISTQPKCFCMSKCTCLYILLDVNWTDVNFSWTEER